MVAGRSSRCHLRHGVQASLQLVNRRNVYVGVSSGERSSSFGDRRMSHGDLRRNLTRMLSPETVAVVGANDQSPMSNNVILPMLEAGHDVVLVNPGATRPTGARSWSTSPRRAPIDAVLSIVNAEASSPSWRRLPLGCGGVVVVASGFAETGPDGVEAQERLGRSPSGPGSPWSVRTAPASATSRSA
jgi:hypothetical protein